MRFRTTLPLLCPGVLPGARPLPDPGPCSTSQTPRQRTAGTALNRAELKLGGWLRGKWRYGFQLLITNPTGEAQDDGRKGGSLVTAQEQGH